MHSPCQRVGRQCPRVVGLSSSYIIHNTYILQHPSVSSQLQLSPTRLAQLSAPKDITPTLIQPPTNAHVFQTTLAKKHVSSRQLVSLDQAHSGIPLRRSAAASQTTKSLSVSRQQSASQVSSHSGTRRRGSALARRAKISGSVQTSIALQSSIQCTMLRRESATVRGIIPSIQLLPMPNEILTTLFPERSQHRRPHQLPRQHQVGFNVNISRYIANAGIIQCIGARRCSSVNVQHVSRWCHLHARISGFIAMMETT